MTFVAREPLSFSAIALDLAPTMALQQLGKFDPSVSITESTFTKVHHDASGALARHVFTSKPDQLQIEVSGADTLLSHWRNQFPIVDGLDTFEPRHPMVRHLLGVFPALRILSMPWIYDVAVGAILQQRVSALSAFGAFRQIALRFGTTTPSGTAIDPQRLATIAGFELQAIGIDSKRARALMGLSRSELRRPLASFSDFGSLREHLLAMDGVGTWTAEMILGFGAGDPDAVPLGDLHLPSLVVRALGREPGGSEARMLELLEPYRGQRFRVIRLLWCGLFNQKTRHLLIAKKR
jgi:3-methyladenine DNA glycosylase/8-oxoguanine DNA glycosylase